MADVMQEKNQFYYKTPELSHRYELILHLLEYSNHLILVAGEKDTGKSSLFSELKTPDESSLVLRSYTATAHTTENDILNALVTDLNASADTFDPWGVNIDDFHHWLGRCQSKQQVPALLIDDADLLADELVDFIFTELSEPKDEAVLHVCLFCEPSFLELARSKEVAESNARSLHIIEMPNFNEKQTAQYLKQRYPDDENGLSVFDEKTVKQIHRISHGMPGRINVLAEQYLNDPAKEVPGIETTTPPVAARDNLLKRNKSIFIVGFLTLLLSVAITYLLYRTEDATPPDKIKIDLPQSVVESTEETDAVKEPASISIPSVEPEPPAIEELTPPVIPELVADVELDQAPEMELSAPEPELAVPDERIQIIEETPLEQEVLSVDAEAGQATAQAKVPEVRPSLKEAQAKRESVAVVSEPEPRPAQKIATLEPMETPGTTEAPRIGVQTKLLAPELVGEMQPESAEVPVVEKPRPLKADEPAPPSVEKDIQWLLQQDPNKYVLQLIGAHEKQTIDAYLQSFADSRASIIGFSTTNDNKPWHVLVYGLYDNRQQAVTDIENLPAQAQKLNPWPRPIRSLRELPIN